MQIGMFSTQGTRKMYLLCYHTHLNCSFPYTMAARVPAVTCCCLCRLFLSGSVSGHVALLVGIQPPAGGGHPSRVPQLRLFVTNISFNFKKLLKSVREHFLLKTIWIKAKLFTGIS